MFFSLYRQLGFASGTATANSYFGSVPAEFAMDNVACSSDDDIIQNCGHLDETGENCGSSEGAGVICQMPTENFVELWGGDGSNNGNVFVLNNNGLLGPVCDDGWTNTDANTVCR